MGAVRPPSGDLPTGVVTFLLADVEGSSRLWEREGDAAKAAVARFYEILDDAITKRDGVRPVEQGEGDSVLGAFSRATDALAAAADAQRALGAEHWATRDPVRVRIAVHTGEADVRDGSYVGLVVTRGARLRELAHGGQTVISRVTHDLVVDRLPDGLSLDDLGPQALRDLARREHVFQLVCEDLDSWFPALRPHDMRRDDLPLQLTRFIGREEEIAQVRDLLRTERMVTLTGCGGGGKTRLALEVGGRLRDTFPDGLLWVDLAALTEPELVPGAVADSAQIPATLGESMALTLERRLAATVALVILDNCEHLVTASAELCSRLLRSCPGLVVLATSREPLGVPGEIAWQVPPMRVGGDVPPAEREAVRLFLDRARLARPTFGLTDEAVPDIVHICEQLDGIPLAIELAAARVRALTPRRIREGLDDRLRTLRDDTGTATPRHQTLEASVEWSHDLLDDLQRVLFRRTAVFAGSFDLDAVVAVCADECLPAHVVVDVLVQLVDRSLVQVSDDGVRYRVLETVRQYAERKLKDAGEADAVLSRHLKHYAHLAEVTGPLVEWGGTEDAVRRLDAELANLRSAMDWSLASRRHGGGLGIATSICLHWIVRTRFAEARTRIEAFLEHDCGPRLRLRSSVALAQIALFGMDFAAAHAYLERSIALAAEIDADDVAAFARSLLASLVLFMQPDKAASVAADLREALPELTNPHQRGLAKASLGQALNLDADIAGARAVLDEAVTEARRSHATVSLCLALAWRGALHWARGAVREAEQDAREGLETARSVGDSYWATIHSAAFGCYIGVIGEPERGRAIVAEALTEARETGNMMALATGSVNSALLAFYLGDVEAVARIAEDGLAIATAVGNRGPWPMLWSTMLAWVEMMGGNVDAAAVHLDDAEGNLDSRPAGSGMIPAFRARLARARGDDNDVVSMARRALTAGGADDANCADALDLLGGAYARLGDATGAARLFGAASVWRSDRGLPRPAGDEAPHLADVETARRALGPHEFEAALAEGSSMSADDAVAFATRGSGARGRPSVGWESLTPTELDVVRLVAAGLSNPQIADELFVSRATVKTHLSHVYAKLGLSSRTELASAATARGSAP